MLKVGGSDIKWEYALVLGGGKFGTNATKFLKSSGARIVIVDINPKCEASRFVNFYVDPLSSEVPSGGIAHVRDDAVLFSMKFFKTKIPKIIVPAIPKHFAGILAYRILSETHRVYSDLSKAYRSLESLPREINSFLYENEGLAAFSYMPFNKRCKEDCLPSLESCPITGIKKSEPLYQTLKRLFTDDFDLNIILPSYQLEAGIGGIFGNDVMRMKEKLEKLKSGWLSITTACLCHGVTNFFKVEPIW